MASPPKYAIVSTFRPIKVLKVDFRKKGLNKKVSVARDKTPYFSEALGFSLPSLLVNSALLLMLLFLTFLSPLACYNVYRFVASSLFSCCPIILCIIFVYYSCVRLTIRPSFGGYVLLFNKN